MKRLTFALVSLLFCAGLGAQEQALVFTRTHSNPVSASLAGADATLSDRISWSAFGNAAAMAFYGGSFDAAVSYTQWAPSTQRADRFAFGAAYHSAGIFSVAIGGNYAKGPSYDVINEDGVSSGTFGTSDMLVGGAAALRLGEKFSLGANVLYARENLFVDGSLSAVLADVSFLYRTGGLRLSAGFAHLGSSVQDNEGTEFSAPASVRLAAGYSAAIAEGHRLELLADGDVYLTGAVSVAGALQYSMNDMLFVRGGYHYGSALSPLPSYLSLGVGANVAGIRIDVAYLTASKTMGNTISFSLGYGF